MELQRVFAATDLSPDGDEVIRQADHIARTRGAQLIVFHALPDFAATSPFFPQDVSLANEQLVGLERRVLLELNERTAALTGRAPATLHVELGTGPADDEIVARAAARNADLIVVGGAGPSRLARALLGAVAENVVRRARSSVLVTRVHAPTHHVVVATDFSNAAGLAIAAAVAQARHDGAALTALHVLEDPSRASGAPPFPQWTPSDLAALAARARDRLAAGLEAIGASGTLHVVPGEPAHAIVEQAIALGADCIVLGTTGQTGFKLSTLGSVAESVVRNARCSVLVVRLLQS